MNNIIQPLRLFTSSDYMLWNRKAIQDSTLNLPLLLVDNTKFIPFYFIHDTDPYDIENEVGITSMKLIDQKGHEIEKYTAFNFLFYTIYANTQAIFTCKANDTLVSNLKTGIYKMQITDGGSNTYYSNWFLIDNSQEYIEFEFSNSVNFEDRDYAPYEKGYKNRIRLRGRTTNKGESIEFKESVSDKNEELIDIFYRKEPLYEVDLLCDRYLLQAINLMHFCDSVYITDHSGIKEQIKIASIESASIGSTYYLSVKVKFFYENEVILKTGTESLTYGDIYDQNATDIPTIVDKKITTPGGAIITTPGGGQLENN